MDFIYNDIVQRFKDNEEVFTSKGLVPIKHFDLFKSQYIYPELHILYKKPALFYEYAVAWSDYQGLKQEGNLTLRIHMEIENYGQSFAHSKNKDYALQVFEYHKRANALLHGFGGSNFHPLRRRSNEPDLNPASTNVHIITYESKVHDDTAQQLKDLGLIKAPIDEMETKQVPLKEQEEGQSKYYI